MKYFRGNLRKIHLLTCNSIKEVKKKKMLENANMLCVLLQEYFSSKKNRIENIDFRKSDLSCCNSLETLSSDVNFPKQLLL